jgi:hypothetical protein
VCRSVGTKTSHQGASAEQRERPRRGAAAGHTASRDDRGAEDGDGSLLGAGHADGVNRCEVGDQRAEQRQHDQRPGCDPGQRTAESGVTARRDVRRLRRLAVPVDVCDEAVLESGPGSPAQLELGSMRRHFAAGEVGGPAGDGHDLHIGDSLHGAVTYCVVVSGMAAAIATAVLLGDRRPAVLGVAAGAALAGPLLWDLILRRTGGRFFTDAPIIVFPVSYEDTVSGVFACALAALGLGLGPLRTDTGRRLAATATICGAAALVVDIYLY